MERGSRTRSTWRGRPTASSRFVGAGSGATLWPPSNASEPWPTWERQLSDDARMDQLMAKISREGIGSLTRGKGVHEASERAEAPGLTLPLLWLTRWRAAEPRKGEVESSHSPGWFRARPGLHRSRGHRVYRARAGPGRISGPDRPRQPRRGRSTRRPAPDASPGSRPDPPWFDPPSRSSPSSPSPRSSPSGARLPAPAATLRPATAQDPARGVQGPVRSGAQAQLQEPHGRADADQGGPRDQPDPRHGGGRVGDPNEALLTRFEGLRESWKRVYDTKLPGQARSACSLA